MDLSFAASNVPPISAVNIQPTSSAPTPANPVNQSIQLVATVALTMLLPSSFQQIQRVSIFMVAKGLVVLPRQNTADRDEKTRVDLLRKVRKVSKSSACDQQNKK